jgi:hypothetical protein
VAHKGGKGGVATTPHKARHDAVAAQRYVATSPPSEMTVTGGLYSLGNMRAWNGLNAYLDFPMFFWHTSRRTPAKRPPPPPQQQQHARTHARMHHVRTHASFHAARNQTAT